MFIMKHVVISYFSLNGTRVKFIGIANHYFAEIVLNARSYNTLKKLRRRSCNYALTTRRSTFNPGNSISASSFQKSFTPGDGD